MTHALVIAEAGVNHDGNLGRAKELVHAAAEAGADAVKFQTFTAEKLVNQRAAKAGYQVGHSKGETQFEMLKQLELPIESHFALKSLATELGLDFISTPFDLESLAFLATEVGVTRIKISSGDLTNLPLLHSAGQTGIPVILSTGMANLGEVEIGVGAVAHGRSTSREGWMAPSSPADFRAALSTNESAALLRDVTLLQCTSLYPTPDSEANLLAMQTLADRFSLEVGLSDHSLGGHLSVAAVALGALVIEKHITLDTRSPGPDHRASMDVDAFRQMIESIRSVEKALGSRRKIPSKQELQNARVVRRGLYAARDLHPGDVVAESDIAILRPQNGVSPYRYWEILGTTVTSKIPRGGDLIL